MMSANNQLWKILIVDDDIHDVTVLTLKRLSFDDQQLQFLHAYSALEARLSQVHDPIKK